MKVNINKLNIAMARACMNSRDLAKAAEVSTNAINIIRRGGGTRPATLGRIARALGVDVAEILKEDDGS